MGYKFIHLTINSPVRFSLKNLIGDNQSHKILIVENNTYKDINEEEILEDLFNSYIQEAQVIFVHFLNGNIARIINNISAHKKIIWFCWGGDAYNLGKFNGLFLQPKTKKVIYKIGFKSLEGFKIILKNILGKYIDCLPPNRSVIKAIQKVNIIVPVVPGDYENLKNKYEVKADVFNVNYINSVFFKQPELDESKARKNILLGNSASFTNNHVEAIDLLSGFDLADAQVFIPLSYGRPKYANYVQKYALNKLGDNARILQDRLPFDDYMALYASCKSVIMNHCRQQAMGNIMLAFWFETTLYLNPNATHYQELVKKGFNVLNVTDYTPNLELSKEEKQENKKLLIRWYGPKHSQNRFNLLLEYIKKNNL